MSEGNENITSQGNGVYLLTLRYFRSLFLGSYQSARECLKYSKNKGSGISSISHFPKNEIPKNIFGDFQSFLGVFLGKLELSDNNLRRCFYAEERLQGKV